MCLPYHINDNLYSPWIRSLSWTMPTYLSDIQSDYLSIVFYSTWIGIWLSYLQVKLVCKKCLDSSNPFRYMFQKLASKVPRYGNSAPIHHPCLQCETCIPRRHDHRIDQDHRPWLLLDQLDCFGETFYIICGLDIKGSFELFLSFVYLSCLYLSIF